MWMVVAASVKRDEKIDVWDDEDQQALHAPCHAIELPDRMQQLLRILANADGHKDGKFIHPVIRARFYCISGWDMIIPS